MKKVKKIVLKKGFQWFMETSISIWISMDTMVLTILLRMSGVM